MATSDSDILYKHILASHIRYGNEDDFDDDMIRTVNCVLNPNGDLSSVLTKFNRDFPDESFVIPKTRTYEQPVQLTCSAVLNHGNAVARTILTELPGPCSDARYQDMYASMDTIKSGILFDKRWKGKQVIIASPNIWMLIDRVPAIDSIIDNDRWAFWMIREGELVRVNPK